MDNAIKSALSPVVRARWTLRQTTGSRVGDLIGEETVLVRGREYEVGVDEDGDLTVASEVGNRVLGQHLFAPVNDAARRLLARPVSPEVKAYRRRVMRALRERELFWDACGELFAELFGDGVRDAIATIRKVRP